MEKQGWKTVAIIFIILFIIETIFLIYAYNIGTRTIKNEQKCAYNVCADYSSYFYSNYDQMCYCYEEHEIVYQEYLG